MKLGYGHFGNGISVWDSTKSDKVKGDYLKVAFIDSNRNITFYQDALRFLLIRNFGVREIIDYARTANPTISASQDIHVFNTIKEKTI